MLNYNLRKLHSRKTIRELIKLKSQLNLETDHIKQKEIQDKVHLCESLKFKDYKLITK